MDKVQSCQTEDTCSQQEHYLWTAKFFVTVPWEAVIFPSAISSTNLAAVFLLPHEVHTGIIAGGTQMQNGRRPLKITSTVCSTSFWNSFSLEMLLATTFISFFSNTRSVGEKFTPLYRGVYNLFQMWQYKLKISPLSATLLLKFCQLLLT